MCDWGDTVNMVVPIRADDSHTGEFRWEGKPIDHCLATIVRALNDAGIYTRSACCGHGKGEGEIKLHDGRTLKIGKEP